MRTSAICLCGITIFSTTVSNASATADIARLFHGEILFESLRDHDLDALLKLNTGLSQYVDGDKNAQDTNSLSSNNISVVDLQLALGLSKQASNSITSQSNIDNREQLRNHAAYQLALFYYNNQKPVEAIRSLDMIHGETKKDDELGIKHLRALAYIRVGKFSAATKILEEIPGDSDSKGYILYNKGIAWLQNGDENKGISALSSLGQIETSNIELLALKDKANLKLGYRYLEAGKPEQAKDYFRLIRLEGPFTNQALLGSGWASFSMGQVERAIVPWSSLHENKTLSDAAVEAKMALPYAYAKLGAHGKAANLYGHAIETFDSELSRLDTTTNAISNGALTQTILDEFNIQEKNWFINILRRNETHQQYLPLLSANDRFRLLVEDLHHLALIKNRFEKWQTSIKAYLEFIKLKQKNYASIMPDAEKETLEIYEKMKTIMEIERQQSKAQSDVKNTETAKLRHSYSNYLLTRKVEAEHHQQLTRIATQLPQLSKQLKLLDNKLNSIVKRADKQMRSVAIDILEQKRKRLQSYRVNALFALAESYDFATRKQQ